MQQPMQFDALHEPVSITQLPLEHAALSGHPTHALPPVPHAPIEVPGRHVVPSQQPAQFWGVQVTFAVETQTPPLPPSLKAAHVRSWPLQSTQACALFPHAAPSRPLWQVPLASQQPLHVDAEQLANGASNAAVESSFAAASFGAASESPPVI